MNMEKEIKGKEVIKTENNYLLYQSQVSATPNLYAYTVRPLILMLCLVKIHWSVKLFCFLFIVKLMFNKP